MAKPVVKKIPINLEILAAMVRDTNENPILANTRLTCACLLGFTGFLHFDELSKLQLTDLSIDAEKLTIQIRHSKTDQLRKGHELVISRSTADTCLSECWKNTCQWPKYNCLTPVSCLGALPRQKLVKG